MTSKQRRAAAYHEAGHAVVGVVLRLGVLYAVVGDDLYPMRGCTRQRKYRLRGLFYPVDRAGREVASLYAGQLAEARAVGRVSRIGASGDEQNIPVVLFGYPLRDWPRMKRQARERASGVLNDHWLAVERIARLIEATGRVTGRQVGAEIARH